MAWLPTTIHSFTAEIAPAARRMCSRSLRCIVRRLAVDGPAFLRRQHAAEGIVLPQPLSFVAFIQQDRAHLFPRPLENGQPFARGNVSTGHPSPADVLR